MRITILLTLKNQADAWKAESKNTIPHLVEQYSNTTQLTTKTKANVSQFIIKDQERMQVSREVREAIHIRRNNPVLNCNIGKLHIPKIFNQMLGTTHNTSTYVSTNPNAQQHSSSSSSFKTTGASNLHN